MQKIKTQEYETYARMISDKPLYEVRFQNKVIITYNKEIRRYFQNTFLLKYYKENNDKFPDINVICIANSPRSAWKKVCRILDKK